MKKEKAIKWLSFEKIADLHRELGLPQPAHPLVSVVNYGQIKVDTTELLKGMMLNFYKVSFKKYFQGKIKYGQGYYDFQEGGLCFFAPGQVITAIEEHAEYEGMTLLFHPDLIRHHTLAGKIKTYGFFSYSVKETLSLAAPEKEIISKLYANIADELSLGVDHFSEDIIISQIELILNYSNRFYSRQFQTRKAVYSDLLADLEKMLDDYFDNNEALMKGVPSVQYLSDRLNVSPRYLGDMLRQYTGQNTQQHIHHKLIEKARQLISTSSLSVAEIAYQLGFEHPQSFIRIFKNKTNLSPLEYRQSINSWSPGG